MTRLKNFSDEEVRLVVSRFISSVRDFNEACFAGEERVFGVSPESYLIYSAIDFKRIAELFEVECFGLRELSEPYTSEFEVSIIIQDVKFVTYIVKAELHLFENTEVTNE